MGGARAEQQTRDERLGQTVRLPRRVARGCSNRPSEVEREVNLPVARQRDTAAVRTPRPSHGAIQRKGSVSTAARERPSRA